MRAIAKQISCIYTIYRTEEQRDKPLTLDSRTYMRTYTMIFDYCVTTKTASKDGSSTVPTIEDLYRSSERETKNRCVLVREIIFILTTDVIDNNKALQEILARYNFQWQRYTQATQLVRNLMQFVERHWIRRVIDEKRKDIHLIRDLHDKIWREQVLQVDTRSATTELRNGQLVDAVRIIQEQGKERTDRDEELIDTFVNSLATLDIALDT